MSRVAQRLSLRNRLLLPFGLLLVFVIALGGYLILERTSHELTAQVDRRLPGALDRVLKDGGLPGNPPSNDVTSARQTNAGPSTASVVVDASGAVVASRPTRSTRDPDPLPHITPTVLRTLLQGKPITVNAVGDAFRYRALAAKSGDLYFIEAGPLRDTDAAVDSLRLTLLVGGSLALLLAMTSAWFILGQGLKPVAQMVTTARMFADGDLSARVGAANEHTELGQLGTALDRMLEQITGALRVREQSEGRLQQFVADASHELHTPVTAIRGYAELFRSGGLQDAEKLRAAMRTIERESVRMGHLIEDLLTVNTMDRARPLHRRSVDVGDIATDAVEVARSIEPNRSIELASAPGVLASIDPERIRQVFDNLLKNVRAHTPGDALVRVTVRRDFSGSFVVVSVQDNGPGISPDVIEHVFDRFWRGDASREGSGLGLAIARSIVEAHGGSITARNSPPPFSSGAIFEVRLPIDHQETFRNSSS